eukprot:scaffold22222_cov56-Attheya_sp.AAC.1
MPGIPGLQPPMAKELETERHGHRYPVAEAADAEEEDGSVMVEEAEEATEEKRTNSRLKPISMIILKTPTR